MYALLLQSSFDDPLKIQVPCVRDEDVDERGIREEHSKCKSSLQAFNGGFNGVSVLINI